MQEITNLDWLKLLLSVIALFSGSNIAVIAWVAKKYIKRADEDHERINRIESEHKVFHKSKTGII
jgi:hypothetical protein